MANYKSIKSEKDLSNLIFDVLNRIGHCQRHEDKYETGVPDLSFGVNGINGWMELKYIKNIKSCNTQIKISNFTEKQKMWLCDRGSHGGHCYLALFCNNVIYFIPWWNISLIPERLWSEIKSLMVFKWDNKIDDIKDLFYVISQLSEQGF